MTVVTLRVETEKELEPGFLADVLSDALGGAAVTAVAEKPAEARERTGDVVCGLPLGDPVPEGWTPLEAVVALRCLVDEPGEGPPLQLHWSPTAGLPSWEASGMCDYLRHQIRLCWGTIVLTCGEGEPGEGDDH
jgi:hypothetical protein